MEDTIKMAKEIKTQTENDLLIEEMQREAKTANEPGEMAQLDVVSKGGDTDAPVPMIASTLTSAGWVYIYDTLTGEPSLCNRNMLRQHLLKVRPDGSHVFTVRKPDIEIKRGKFKCLLHEDDPNREHYKDMGFQTCRKSNLNSIFQRDRHMAKRHKDEWAAIQAEKADIKAQEDRDFNRQLLQSVTGRQVIKPAKPRADALPGTEAYISDKDRADNEGDE